MCPVFDCAPLPDGASFPEECEGSQLGYLLGDNEERKNGLGDAICCPEGCTSRVKGVGEVCTPIESTPPTACTGDLELQTCGSSCPAKCGEAPSAFCTKECRLNVCQVCLALPPACSHQERASARACLAALAAVASG